VCRHAGTVTGIPEQQQSEQTPDLRLGRQEFCKQPCQSDRLLLQIDSRVGGSGGRIDAVGEDEADGAQDSRQSVDELIRSGTYEWDLGLRDQLLSAIALLLRRHGLA